MGSPVQPNSGTGSAPTESRTWGSYLPGTTIGEDSAQWYADRFIGTDNPFVYVPAAVGGGFASLWTPDTATETTFNLATGGLVSVGKAAVGYAGAKIIGTAQSTGTLGHATVSKTLAYMYALNPNVSRVTLDLGYKRLLEGVQAALSKYGPRPDVGVRFKDGIVKVVEVASKTDNPSKLILRNEQKMLRDNIQGTVQVNNWAVWINKIFGG